MPKVTLSIDGNTIDEVRYGLAEVLAPERESQEAGANSTQQAPWSPAPTDYQHASDHLPVVRLRLYIALSSRQKDNIEKWALAAQGKAWRPVVMGVLDHTGRRIQTWTVHNAHVIGYKTLPESNIGAAGARGGDVIELVVRGNINKDVVPAKYTEDDIVKVEQS